MLSIYMEVFLLSLTSSAYSIFLIIFFDQN